MKVAAPTMLAVSKPLIKYAKFMLAFLCFPLLGSSCETLDSNSTGLSSDVDRIQSIQDPNQRAAANTAWAQSMTQNLNSSMQRAGIDPNQMAYQSNYDAARRRGMTPAEADAEARQFVEMWQMMSR